MSTNQKPIIVAFVADLMFSVRIENIARELGFTTQLVGRSEDLPVIKQSTGPHRPGEPLHGQVGSLFNLLTEWQPALMIFDLGNEHIPWANWIATLKSSPATRRLPILCYGPHVDTESLNKARDVGADEVVPRSRFSSAMPELIQQLSYRPDNAALTEACLQPLSEKARAGIEHFNQGQYYDAHHGLEEAWVEDTGPGRDLYRAILQIGVSYYQIERGNYRGAVKMLLRVRQWLAPLPEICRGVNVSRLRQDVDRVYEAIQELGEERIADFDRSLFRLVELTQ